ncbi:DoxX family protein [Erythrobacter sp. WG]|uniref:DoxX family protein n=1 Tax=Erythrobacter sp. WG TaxID=2985510 RepID=UPI00226D81B1|nr:DoxX family protein [Erythrobacter sp. WG]MCX9145945.1 DoxX family protein [Erythrobacter sp. WG]
MDTPRAFPLWLLRLALASPFLFSGLTKALDFTGATAEVRGLTGLKPAGAFAAAVVAVQLGGSALLLAGGWAVGIGAALLAGFTLVATLVAHDFWNRPAGTALRDATTFFEHVALIAGLGLAAWVSARRPG